MQRGILRRDSFRDVFERWAWHRRRTKGFASTRPAILPLCGPKVVRRCDKG
jgi:hypothetical protein